MSQRRIRWLFLALLFGSTLLNYLDRQTLSVLKPTLSLEFGFSNQEYSYLVTVFLVPYIAMYLLSGPLVDRFGSRRCMAWFVGIWSLATLFSGLARSAWQLGAARFLLGLAEPGNMPAAARATADWFPAEERGLAVSIFSAGSAVGSIVALPLTAFLAHTYGWRSAFVALGGCGVLWVIAWLAFFREPPRNAAVRKAPLPWLDLFKSRPLMAVLLARMISDPVWYFMLFWIPTFFQERKGLSLTEVGSVGWIPFLVADIGGILAGYVADRMIRRGRTPAASRLRVLRTVAWIGLAGALLALRLDVGPAMVVFSIIGVACMTWFFLTAALIADLFPPERVAGALGIVGAAGALGAAIFNLFVGSIVDVAGFPVVFCIMAVLHPLAGLILARGTRVVVAQAA